MILVLDHFDSFTYNLVQGLRQCNVEVTVQTDTSDPIDLSGFTHIVLSPGAGKPADSKAGRNILDYATHHMIPVLGVCLGHQIIAEFFGGTVEQMSEPAHAQECQITHESTGLFTGVKSPMIVGQYHSLHVVRENRPSTLQITAKTDDGIIMAFQHKTHPIYGIQFHPESVFTPQGQKILENFLIMQHNDLEQNTI